MRASSLFAVALISLIVGLVPASVHAAMPRYAALGDSVAAGAGLNPGSSCGRAGSAYPALVAEHLGYRLDHIACSGATMGDLVSYQGVDGPNIAPQLRTAFATGTPELITITAGANDTQWDNFLRKCYYLSCGTSSDDRAFRLLLTGLKAKLTAVFASVQWRSGFAPPPVVLTGYYQVFSPACARQQPRLRAAEIRWMNARTADINRTLQSAAAKRSSYVSFAPVSFAGHELCTSDPWVQSTDAVAPFHPTARGQAAIAEAVASKM